MARLLHVLLFTFCLLHFTGCITDNCDNVACVNGGVCVQSYCTCPAGFEGRMCEMAWNEKFDGDWQAKDTYSKVKDTATHKLVYKIGIAGSIDSLLITGLMDTIPLPITCYRNSRWKFDFKANQIVDSFLTIKGGKGTLDSTTSTVTGQYTYGYKGMIESKKVDTSITINFRWTR